MEKLRELYEEIDIKFIKSAAKLDQCPETDKREFALLGRSNVGKSSFLNHIFSSKAMAKVSKQPGKTRLLNYFNFNEDINFVDLPGYGYAKVSHSARDEWGGMMRKYCAERENLAGIIWLIDYRRENGTDIDIEAAQWLMELGIPVFVILTKSDKLNQKEQGANFRSIKKVYQFNDSTPLVRYTTTRDKSRDIFWTMFQKWESELNK